MQKKNLRTLGEKSEALWYLNMTRSLFLLPQQGESFILHGAAKNTGLYFPHIPVRHAFSPWESKPPGLLILPSSVLQKM